MKYTNYLLKGNFINLGHLKSNNILLIPITTTMSIIIAFIGLLIIAGLLPATFVVDEYRGLKYQLIKLERSRKVEIFFWFHYMSLREAFINLTTIRTLTLIPIRN